MNYFISLIAIIVSFYILKKIFSGNPIEKNSNPLQIKTSDDLQKNADKINKDVLDILEKNKTILSCLVFIGRADGKMMTKEIDVIAKTIIKISGRSDIEPWMMDQQIRDIKKISPDEFKRNVKNIAGNKHLFEILAATSKKIIATQKTAQAGELYCLQIIEELTQ